MHVLVFSIAVIAGAAPAPEPSSATSLAAVPSSTSAELPSSTPSSSPPTLAPVTTSGMAWGWTIHVGVERNQGLLTERFERERATVRTRSVWAVWSPSLFLDSRLAHTDIDGGAPTDDRLGYTVGATWQNAIGTRLEAAVGVDQGLGGAAVHEPLLSFSLVQPLLKDAWLDGAGLSLTEANLSRQIQNEIFCDVLNSFIADVDGAYWDVSLAQADLDIKARSLLRAQNQFNDTKENISRGILADAEIYVVEESLVIFESEHRRAQQRLLLAQNALAALLYFDGGASIVAGEALAIDGVVVPGRDESVAAALSANPRVRAQRLRVQLAEARQRFAFNQILPSLGLRSTVGLRGKDAGYPAAWGDLVGQPSVNAEVGLRLAVPLDRNSVNAELEAAELDVKREGAELERQENLVRFAVENALAALHTDLTLAGQAQRQQHLADLKLKAQMEKYKTGLSTLQDVVRFQRELDDAMISVQRVMRAVRVGRTQLLRNTGALHDVVGVSVGVSVVDGAG